MKSFRELLNIVESIEQDELEYTTPPARGDLFAIEIDDNGGSLLESHIMTASNEHVVLECDEEGFSLLEGAGCTFSEDEMCHKCDHKVEECCCEELDEAEYHGRHVELNKPTQGDVKKFKVYVKDPKTGNIKKVNFGQKGMNIKKSNPARRKSFRARHKCSTAHDKTSARYWSCRKW